MRFLIVSGHWISLLMIGLLLPESRKRTFVLNLRKISPLNDCFRRDVVINSYLRLIRVISDK